MRVSRINRFSRRRGEGGIVFALPFDVHKGEGVNVESDLSTLDTVRVLIVALEVFRDAIDPEAPLQRVMTFLAIAANHDMPQYELEKAVKGVSASAFSRNIADLTAIDRNRKPGPGLVLQAPDPYYRRRNLLRLTTKGEQLMAEITDRMNRALSKAPRQQEERWRYA